MRLARVVHRSIGYGTVEAVRELWFMVLLPFASAIRRVSVAEAGLGRYGRQRTRQLCLTVRLVLGNTLEMPLVNHLTSRSYHNRFC